MGRLTTHVLDTATGRPAEGMTITLRSGDGTEIKTVVTNADGRVDSPLLIGADLIVGTYELLFHVGEYLDRTSPGLAEPKFLDLIPLRFGVSDATAHYHVPLLLSPYGYSTYRGS